MSYNSLGTAAAGFWPFTDNAASTTVLDSLGANNGTLTGAGNTSASSVTGPTGYLATGLTFTTSSYVNFGSSTSLRPPNGKTYEFWVRSLASGNFTVLRFANTSSYFALNLSGRPILLLGASNFQYFDASATTTLLDGNWHHVALVIAGTAQADIANCAMYLDGASVAKSGAATQSGGTTAIDRFWVPYTTAMQLAGVGVHGTILSAGEVAERFAGPEPTNDIIPSISGTATIGSELTCDPGTWDAKNNGALSYGYQWTRSDDGSGSNEADISGATSATYTLQIADAGKYVRCRVRASNSGGFDAASDTNSNFTNQVASDAIAPTIQSVTVAASGLSVTVGFNEAVTGGTGCVLQVTGSTVTLTYASGSGTNSLVFTPSRSIMDSQVATFDYVDGDIEDLSGNALANITGVAVTNNSTATPNFIGVLTKDGSEIATVQGLTAADISFNIPSVDSGDTGSYTWDVTRVSSTRNQVSNEVSVTVS